MLIAPVLLSVDIELEFSAAEVFFVYHGGELSFTRLHVKNLLFARLLVNILVFTIWAAAHGPV